MKLFFTILALLLLAVAASFFFASQHQPAWNHHSLPVSVLPYRLRSLLPQDDEALAKLIDIRHTAPSEEFYSERALVWRMRSDKAAEESHVKAFYLKEIKPHRQKENRLILLMHVPKDWGSLSAEDMKWLACDWNHREGNLGDWYTMAVCKKTKTLYFLHANWSYIP